MSTLWSNRAKLVVCDKTLEYAYYGPPPANAPTLILLHEGLGSVSLWRDFPQQLAAATGWGVLAYSRAGYGMSDLADLPRPLDYMSIEATVVLPEVLDAVGLKQGVLLGHSDGATIAAIYAGHVADKRLLGIALMAPHFFTEPVGLQAIAEAKIAYDTGMLRQRMAKYHRDPDNTFRGWNDSWLHPDFERWNVASVLNTINVPVLAIQGKQDQYGTLRQLEEIELRCPTNVNTLVLDDCRHSPFLDQPQAVISGTAEFCHSVAVP